MWVHHPPPTHPEHAQQRGGAQSSARSSGLHSRGLRGSLNLPHTALEGEAAGSRGGRPVFPDGKLSFLSFRGQRIISVTLKRSQGRCGLERDMDSTGVSQAPGPQAAALHGRPLLAKRLHEQAERGSAGSGSGFRWQALFPPAGGPRRSSWVLYSVVKAH